MESRLSFIGLSYTLVIGQAATALTIEVLSRYPNLRNYWLFLLTLALSPLSLTHTSAVSFPIILPNLFQAILSHSR